MSWFKSLVYSLREAHYNLATVIHAGCYAATVSYLRLLKKLRQTESSDPAQSH